MPTQMSNKYRFSQWLMWEKNRRRMTTTEFSRLCGVSPTAMTNYLGGINWPPMVNLFMLTLALKAKIQIEEGDLAIKNSSGRWMFSRG